MYPVQDQGLLLVPIQRPLSIGLLTVAHGEPTRGVAVRTGFGAVIGAQVDPFLTFYFGERFGHIGCLLRISDSIRNCSILS